MDHLHKRARKGVVWWHTPNAPRNAINGAMLKRMGMLAGVSDLSILVDGKFCALELKAPGKKPNDNQQKYLFDIQEAGGFAAHADNLDAALDWLTMWGVFR